VKTLRKRTTTAPHGAQGSANDNRVGSSSQTASTDFMLCIANRLTQSVGKVQYGEVSVALKIHSGRVVDLTHTVNQSVRERLEVDK